MDSGSWTGIERSSPDRFGGFAVASALAFIGQLLLVFLLLGAVHWATQAREVWHALWLVRFGLIVNIALTGWVALSCFEKVSVPAIVEYCFDSQAHGERMW
jgi:hypothetical protein